MIRRRLQAAAGFSLIELMVTITLMSILVMLAVPSFSEWVQNNKVRTVSESLQNGLRLAQTEAVRRSRQVVFSLTNSPNPKTAMAAAANGRNWSLNVVKLLEDDAPGTSTDSMIESGTFASVGTDITITGPISVCFNSVGRVVANQTPGPTNAVCNIPATLPIAYTVTTAAATRPLRVTVGLGGQVRMCDPARSLANAPDGC